MRRLRQRASSRSIRRPRLLAILALTVTFLVVPPATTPAAAATELVTNGTFSAGTTGWAIPSAGGVETCCAAPPNGYPNAFFHPNGLGSGTGLNGYLVTWQNIAGATSGTYTLRANVRTSGSPQGAILQADNGTFETPYCRAGPSATATWAVLTCTFNYTAGQTLHVAFGTSNLPATNGGWVAFDDISLQGGGSSGTYDLATFIVRSTNGPVYHFTTNENMQIQVSGGFEYQAKNGHWEEFKYDNSYIYRYRDTSCGSCNPPTFYAQFTGSSTSHTAFAPWVPRFVTIGQVFTRNPFVQSYNWGSCVPIPGGGNDTSTITVVQFYPSWASPGGVSVPNVILLQARHNTTANGPNTLWESYWYAQGYGLVGFEAHDINTPGDPIAVNGTGYINSFSGTTPSREGVCGP